MKKKLSSISTLLPIMAFFFTVFFGVICALFFYFSLGENYRTNTHNSGTLLAKELAISSLQPLIHRDTLSIQVAITEISSIPGVSRASVYDEKKQLIAQSQASATNHTEIFSAPIVLEGEPAGFAEIALDKTFLFAPYQKFLQWAFILWAILSGLIIFTTWWFGKKWGDQISALTKQLPNSEPASIDTNCSEIAQLRQALEPILNNTGSTAQAITGSSNHYRAILLLSCRNLSRLQTQLSENNVRDVLNSLDDIISFILKLYDGQRLNTYNQTISLSFKGTEASSDHCLRALYASFSALELIEQLQSSKSLKIDCAIAITSAPMDEAENHIQAALLMEKQLSRSDALLNIASINKILLDRETATHPALDDTALLEPLSPDQQMFRCEGLEETAESLVKRQTGFFKPEVFQ